MKHIQEQFYTYSVCKIYTQFYSSFCQDHDNMATVNRQPEINQKLPVAEVFRQALTLCKCRRTKEYGWGNTCVKSIEEGEKTQVYFKELSNGPKWPSQNYWTLW